MITVQDISHTYTGPPNVEALSNISFELKDAETVSIIGQSGCGKTTVLRAVAGLLAPTSGKIEIGGKSAFEARKSVTCGFVAQNPELFSWRTVAQNILLPFELRSSSLNSHDREDFSERVEQIALKVGLERFMDAFPHQLSGGMKARAALARALAFRPKALLLDEPFSSLDEITRRKLNEDLLDLQDSTSVTVLLVTHSLREAAFLSDHIVVLTPRPGTVRRIVKVPHLGDRKKWRNSQEFSEFCSMLYREVESGDSDITKNQG